LFSLLAANSGVDSKFWIKNVGGDARPRSNQFLLSSFFINQLLLNQNFNQQKKNPNFKK